MDETKVINGLETDKRTKAETLADRVKPTRLVAGGEIIITRAIDPESGEAVFLAVFEPSEEVRIVKEIVIGDQKFMPVIAGWSAIGGKDGNKHYMITNQKEKAVQFKDGEYTFQRIVKTNR